MTGVGAKGGAAASLEVRRGGDDGPKVGIQLTNPVENSLREFAEENLRRHGDLPHVREGMFATQTLAICGAGPSLVTEIIHPVDQVWGCNSALTYLWETDRRVTGGVSIDQTPAMLEEWRRTFDVDYFVATTVDPKLLDHLRAADRRITLFHSMTGFDGELEHYREEWPPSYFVSTGATVVGRAVALAAWLGFRRVDVYGADCALGPNEVAHANGDSVEEAYGANTLLMKGNIMGREWLTRPDMLMNAVDLVRLCKKFPGHVRLMGDTLPVALMGMDDAYLDQVVRRLEPGETPT